MLAGGQPSPRDTASEQTTACLHAYCSFSARIAHFALDPKLEKIVLRCQVADHMTCVAVLNKKRDGNNKRTCTVADGSQCTANMVLEKKSRLGKAVLNLTFRPFKKDDISVIKWLDFLSGRANSNNDDACQDSIDSSPTLWTSIIIWS